MQARLSGPASSAMKARHVAGRKADRRRIGRRRRPSQGGAREPARCGRDDRRHAAVARHGPAGCRASGEPPARLPERDRFAVTMTGELSISSPTGERRAALLAAVARRAVGRDLVYAVPSGSHGRAPHLRSRSPPPIGTPRRPGGAAAPAMRCSSIWGRPPPTRRSLAGRVADRGFTDAERLATGELVYTGLTRTPFAVAKRAPFRGR